MNIAMDSQWNHEAANFAMDNNDYEKAFESYISDVEDDDEDFEGNHGYPRLYQPEQHQNQQHDENQQINEIFIEIPPPQLRLDLCPVCSRRFAPDTLMKHVIICERINTKKRKPFDSSRQRLKGTEFIASAPTEVRVSPPKVLQRKASETSLKSHPSVSHEHRNILDNMSRKSSTISLSSTASRPLIKRSVSQPSEKCPHCERTFGYKAYDRHVEWCKEKALIKPSPACQSVSIAKERLKTRVNYKAPNLKTKRGVTREKYSNSCNGSTNSLNDFESTIHSMTSSMTSENGMYDPFLSAKKQLEELFSPTTTPSTKMINSMMATPSNIRSNKSNDIMSKSFTSQSSAISPKTPQPIPKMQSNFRRTSSLRIPNRKPKAFVYTPPVRSNIHCGIDDEGPISPNFVKAQDYDELPIKSPYSAIKQCESQVIPARASPSPTMPSIAHKPHLREKGAVLSRKNLKLDIQNPNKPSADYPLSKTDSLALFLKYEHELAAQMSEKDLKDKSNSLSKRSANFVQKLPDINGKQRVEDKPSNISSNNVKEEQKLIAIDKLNMSHDDNDGGKSHSAPVKLINTCDNLPLLNNGSNSNSDKSRSPSIDRRNGNEVSPVSRRSASTLRRQMKYNIDNILFDKAPEVTTKEGEVKSTPSSSDNSNNNSLIRPESRASNAESIFEDFDFDQFIASFTDDDQFPIFKDYKMLMNKSTKADEENNNNNKNNLNVNKTSNNVTANVIASDQAAKEDHANSKPIPIQQKSESEMTGMEKLDSLCKMLANSDSDESNSEAQTRSKSSADSAYGRQSQSPLDYRRIHNGSVTQARPTQHANPMSHRQHLELKTTEIVLNPVKPPSFQETIMIPRNGNPLLTRSISTDEQSELKYSKFCHECGYKFVVPTAKFCIECGVRRIKI